MKLDSYVRVPRDVISRTDLTPAAKLVMAALHGRAWGDKVVAWPTVGTIAKDIGMSDRAVRYAIGQLVDLKLIEVKHIRDHNNPCHNTSNHYTIKRDAAHFATS